MTVDQFTRPMSAKEFKTIRSKLELTSAQLARLLKVNPVTVRRYQVDDTLEGNRSVPIDVAARMREFVNGYRPKDWPRERST